MATTLVIYDKELLTRTVWLEVLSNENVETRLRNPSVDVNEGRVLVDVEEADVGIGSFWSGSSSSASGWNEWNNSALQTINSFLMKVSCHMRFKMHLLYSANQT